MIILDTNVMYRLLGFESDHLLDIDKLKQFIKDNVCECSYYTIFEILNSSISFDKKKKIFKYMKDNAIIIGSTEEINREFEKELLKNKEKDEAYYHKLKMIYGKEIIQQTSNNLSFFIMCYGYTCSTICIDNYEVEISPAKKYFRKHFEIQQRKNDNHIKRVLNNRLQCLLEQDRLKAQEVQDEVQTIIINIMTYYYEWLGQAKILFESGDKNAYYKVTKIFKNLSKKMNNDNFTDIVDMTRESISICKIIIDNYNNDNEYPNLKPGKVKLYLKQKVIDSIYFVDERMRNLFEESWLSRFIQSLYIENGILKFNDFIDYEILRLLYYYDKYDKIITFDNKMKNIMKDVIKCDKFTNSIKLIDSFKKLS